MTEDSHLKDALDKLYQASTDNNPFYGLYELVENENTIIKAIHNIKSNTGSKTPGIDNKKMEYYLKLPREKLLKLVRKTMRNYRPLPVKRVEIPKDNGKTRPLGIPVVLDRIIQECVRIVLEPICEAKFHPHSYGFRPYRATEHALASLIDRIHTSKTYIAIDADIKGYFDNVDHNILMKQLWNMGIRDKRVLALIRKMLKAGVMIDNKLESSDIGTPQGGIISPLLANVYLNGLDWMISDLYLTHPATEVGSFSNRHRRLKKKGHHHEPTYLVRYADDGVILCQTETNAERLLTKCKKFLKHKRKLELSEEKTKICDLRKEGINFLGFVLTAGPTIENPSKITGKLTPRKDKISNRVRELNDLIRELPNLPNDRARATVIESVNTKLVGITNYYKIGNSKKWLSIIDNRMSWTIVKAFWKMHRKGWRKHVDEVSTFNNWTERNKGYEGKSCFVIIDGVKIGFTKAIYTPTNVNAMKFNQNMKPYTVSGRQLYWTRKQSKGIKEPRSRPPLYNPEDLYVLTMGATSGSIYNFEYHMNREYAYNRDRGKCSCCSNFLGYKQVRTHHKNPRLPMNLINKVSNLTTVCILCHNWIHANNEPNISQLLGKKHLEKIKKLRGLLRTKK